MTEQDNIRDIFSKGLENHTTPVRPEVWNGLQAKMAASGSAAAAKGISVLAKWIIGGAAVTAVSVTAVVLTNTQAEKQPSSETKQEVTSSPDPDKQPGTVTPPAVSDNILSASSANEQTSEPSAARKQNQQPETYEYQVKDRTNVTPSIGIVNEIPGDYIAPAASASGSSSVSAGSGAVSPKADAAPKATETPAVSDKKPLASRSKIVRIPNVFTPNGDGDNDDFGVATAFVSDFSVTIMDQKNNVVFRSSNPDFVWDGRMMNGDECPAGSYYCLIIARGENQEMLKEYKVVQLMR